MRTTRKIIPLAFLALLSVGCRPDLLPTLADPVPAPPRPVRVTAPTTTTTRPPQATPAPRRPGGGRRSNSRPTTTVPVTTTTTTTVATTPTTTTTAPPPQVAMYVYGHSFTVTTPANGSPWPSQVAAATGYSLQNRGHGGDTIDQTADRVSPAASGDVVLVEASINDVRGFGLAGLDNFQSTLAAITAALAADGATVWVVLDPQIRNWAYPGWDQGSPSVLAAYSDAARATWPNVIDTTPGWDVATMISGDDVHPNTAGMAHIAAAVVAAL